MSQPESGESVVRLEVLETKVAYQDRTLEDLNEVVIRQQGQIETLEREVKKLRTALEEDGSAQVAAGEEPPPPHY
jgi:SlyX protein